MMMMMILPIKNLAMTISKVVSFKTDVTNNDELQKCANCDNMLSTGTTYIDGSVPYQPAFVVRLTTS